MSGSIFFLDSDDALAELNEEPYNSEALLQRLIARHPSLLAGDQIQSEGPRRWLLIDREVSLVDPDSGEARWSMDHLFLDQDAVPTLVEVKRSTDAHIRRAVVGQMLDYASQIGEVSVDRFRGAFEARCAAEKRDPDQVLAELLESAADVEAFWRQAGENLAAGKIRLLFVSDRIPVSLRRIVEFLNQRMDPTEVLAVEIRQLVGEGKKTLVPRVLGQTVRTARSKGTPARQWDEPTFLADLEKRHGPPAVEVAGRLLEWAKERDLRLWWGQGKKDGSFFPLLDQPETLWTFSVWTYGRIEIQFRQMVGRPVFGDAARREELRRRLCETGIEVPPDAIERRPSFQLAQLSEEDRLQQFFAVWDWYLSEIGKSV